MMKIISTAILSLLVAHVASFSVVRQSSSSRLVTQRQRRASNSNPHVFLLFSEKSSSSNNGPAVLEREATMPTNDSDSSDVPEEASAAAAAAAAAAVEEQQKPLSESQKLMKQVKEAGTAGIISYALWELGFWAVSVPVVLFGYISLTGHFPDLSNKEDTAKLAAEAFAFVNFARFAVPLRIGLALSTTPWIQENIVDRFMNKKDDDETKIEKSE